VNNIRLLPLAELNTEFWFELWNCGVNRIHQYLTVQIPRMVKKIIRVGECIFLGFSADCVSALESEFHENSGG